MADGFSALPPLNALRVFEVVARHLNFRLAADELGVTQAAVAQQIRGLEANLGLKLFDRLPRGACRVGASTSLSSNPHLHHIALPLSVSRLPAAIVALDPAASRQQERFLLVPKGKVHLTMRAKNLPSLMHQSLGRFPGESATPSTTLPKNLPLSHNPTWGCANTYLMVTLHLNNELGVIAG